MYSRAIASKPVLKCIRGAVVGRASIFQVQEVGQGGFEAAGLSSTQESLAQAMPSLPLTLSFPKLVGVWWGMGGEGGLSHLGGDLVPPGRGEAQEPYLPQEEHGEALAVGEHGWSLLGAG